MSSNIGNREAEESPAEGRRATEAAVVLFNEAQDARLGAEDSKRKGAEAVPLETEDHYRAIVNQNLAGILEIDLTGNVIFANDQFCTMVGYSRDELSGMHISQFVHEDDLPESHQKLGLLASEGMEFEVQKRFVRKDGSMIWVHNSVSAITSPGGRPAFAAVISFEVTERKAAEDAVRQTAEFLRTVLNSVDEYAIVTLDSQGAITGWNPGALNAFGYTEEEVLNQKFDILFNLKDREAGAPQQELKTASETGRATDERWHVRKDGSHFYLSGVTSQLRAEGQGSGFVKIARDMTAQRQFQEALSASEARFRTLSDVVPQIIWANEPNGKANYFNSRWFEYTGLTLAESLGPGWQAIVHPDDAPASKQSWQRALEAGERFDVEFRLRRSDGIYRWQIGRNVPLREADGRIIGWFGTATDIQDLKEAEEARRQSHDLLEERVQERTRELQEEVARRRGLEVQRKQLMQRIVQVQEQERGRISRELHDNLGQHATAIMISLQLLQDAEAKPQHGERRQSAVQLERLHQQMDELLDMTHRLAWELRPAVLDNVGLDAALREYISEWKRHGVACDFISRLPEAEAGKTEIGISPDAETALYRVAQEALTNVLRHAKASQVSVVLERSSQYVTVIVEDDGLGFDPTSTSIRLGLRGMQERMELVGGTLEIESSPGEGTGIYARVPLVFQSNAQTTPQT